jgi:hypothetical protein
MNGVIQKIEARAKQKKLEQAEKEEEDTVHCEKIEIEGQEFLVEKKQGLVFKDDGKGMLVHVGQWEDTGVEGEGQVTILNPDQRDPKKNLQLA